MNEEWIARLQSNMERLEQCLKLYKQKQEIEARMDEIEIMINQLTNTKNELNKS